MKRMLIAALMLLAAAPALIAQQPTTEERRAMMHARRDSLETRVVQQFVVRLGTELNLTDEQRAQTQVILVASGRERRQLANETAALRARLGRSVRSAETTDAEFTAILAEFDVLRTREHELWRRDQEQLAAVMSPRQRAQFLVMWGKFQDDMREILSRRMREEQGRRQHDRRQEQDAPKPERAPGDTISEPIQLR